MKSCLLSDKHKCTLKKKRTKDMCLYCILERIQMSINCLMGHIGFDVKVPLGRAVCFTNNMKGIDEAYGEFIKWMMRHHPKARLKQPKMTIQKTFEEAAKKYTT